ncbi:hypothetical protein ACFE04_028395 [Oxalis oulophora]
MSPCRSSKCSSSLVKLILYGGTRKTITGKKKARDIMIESLPDKVMVCQADSFFLGHPIPILTNDDKLLPGQTYFVLPINFFPSNQVLSVSSLSALLNAYNSSSSPNKKNSATINFSCDSFDYIKGENGRVLMKVMPEYIATLINVGDDQEHQNENDEDINSLCNTSELRRQYEMLVGSKKQVWTPKLETISESNTKTRFSPCIRSSNRCK